MTWTARRDSRDSEACGICVDFDTAVHLTITLAGTSKGSTTFLVPVLASTTSTGAVTAVRPVGPVPVP